MNDEKATDTPIDETEKVETAPSDGPAAEEQAGKSGGEVGGPKGPEPTRYGDWEKKGRCIDF